jgi:catalase
MADEQLVQEALHVMETHGGAVKGYRRAHARGLALRGTFTPSPEIRALTVAEHLQGPPVPVIVRLSNASGDPHAPDLTRNAWSVDQRNRAT